MGVAGAVAAGALAAWVYCRRTGIDIGAVALAAAPALAVAQAISVWGNWFSQELYGRPSGLPWAVEISPQHRVAGFQSFATFQPLFLYESLFDLLIAWPSATRSAGTCCRAARPSHCTRRCGRPAARPSRSCGSTTRRGYSGCGPTCSLWSSCFVPRAATWSRPEHRRRQRMLRGRPSRPLRSGRCGRGPAGPHPARSVSALPASSQSGAGVRPRLAALNWLAPSWPGAGRSPAAQAVAVLTEP